jgi:hypothetical protein
MSAQYRSPAPDPGGSSPARLAATVEDAEPWALTVCSVCLRVFDETDWVDAEAVIRQLRSFDLAAAPRLKPALCDRCVESLRERRLRRAEPLAA